MLATQELVALASTPGGQSAAGELGPHVLSEIQSLCGGPPVWLQPRACCQVHALGDPGAHSRENVANSESDVRLQSRGGFQPALDV